MRLSRRSILLIVMLLLLIGGAYRYYWLQVASGLRQTLTDWEAAQRGQGATVAWESLDLAGFPFAFRITLEHPVYGGGAGTATYRIEGPSLVGAARPWSLRTWRIEAPSGARLTYGGGPDGTNVTIDAARLRGDVAQHLAGADGIARPAEDILVEAGQIVVAAPARFTIGQASGRVVLPRTRAADHREISIAGSLLVQGLTLPPDATTPLGDGIARISASLALHGDVPPGRLDAALAAWRDDGGTLDLSDFALDWGALAGTAKGTFSLDPAMQPEGALTATIAGYGATMDAMVAARSIKPGDGEIAKVALGLLAKPGPDGRPVLTQPVTLQNGSLFLGPVRLLRVPRVTWPG